MDETIIFVDTAQLRLALARVRTRRVGIIALEGEDFAPSGYPNGEVFVVPADNELLTTFDANAVHHLLGEARVVPDVETLPHAHRTEKKGAQHLRLVDPDREKTT